MKRSLVFHCFFAIWPGGRRCANCRNAHFLRGTVMKAYSHEKHARKKLWKNQKNKKNKSSDPWARSGERPGWGHGSELVVFFCFSMVFLQFGQNLEKKKKVQTHGQGLGRGLAGDMGLNLLIFVFFVFPWFFAVWPKPRENKKKKKSSDPWARSGERPGWGHGSLLFFFWGFPWFFAVWPKPRENQKKQKKQKVQTHGQGLGRGLAGDMGLIFFHDFFA